MLIGLVKSTNVLHKGVFHVEQDSKDVYTILVPQYTVQQIPIYKFQLENALRTKPPDEIPKIFALEVPPADTAQANTFVKTLSFIGGTPLPAFDAAGVRPTDTLNALLAVYDMCIVLKTAALERAVLDHLGTYHYPHSNVFIDFARDIYGDTGPKKRAVDSSIGRVIKIKLAALLPRLLKDGDVKRITVMGGVLSTELLEVTIKHFSGGSDIKPEPSVKVE
jgi:hypothetical protein